jgi:hypothetical protein
MSIPDPDDGKKRMSRSVKLAFMGVGGAALLYSCAPAIGGAGGLTALPIILGMSNPFYRQPHNCRPAAPGASACEPNQASSSSGSSSSSSSSGYRGSSSSSTASTTGGSSSEHSTSSRGGFGSTAGAHGSSGSS